MDLCEAQILRLRNQVLSARSLLNSMKLILCIWVVFFFFLYQKFFWYDFAFHHTLKFIACDS